MKIKIDSDEDLPLEKTLRMYKIRVLIKSVFNRNHNHYYCVLLSEKFLYKQRKKCYIMTDLTFLTVLMLIRQVHLKNVLFSTNSMF